jgi:RNA polymerase sigma-70 factor (sigma-E family)
MRGAGDDAADSFTSWARAEQQPLLRSAYLLTGDLHRAQDLVQEALLKVAVRWSRLEAENPRAFARTVMYRDYVSWWRRRRPSSVESLPEVGAAQDADAAERRLMVHEALGQLTAKQRAVLVLRFYDDLSEQATARVLNVGVGTVKSQTSAALRRLRTRSPELAELLGAEGEST